MNQSTKTVQTVPEHWVNATDQDGKPRAFGGAVFTEAPGRDGQVDTGGPSLDWKLAQLKEHATTHGIDLTGATTKAEILTAITTPAAGDNTEMEQ